MFPVVLEDSERRKDWKKLIIDISMVSGTIVLTIYVLLQVANQVNEALRQCLQVSCGISGPEISLILLLPLIIITLLVVMIRIIIIEEFPVFVGEMEQI